MRSLSASDSGEFPLRTAYRRVFGCSVNYRPARPWAAADRFSADPLSARSGLGHARKPIGRGAGAASEHVFKFTLLFRERMLKWRSWLRLSSIADLFCLAAVLARFCYKVARKKP